MMQDILPVERQAVPTTADLHIKQETMADCPAAMRTYQYAASVAG